MPVGLILDACFEEHDTGVGHPENPERLSSIRSALTSSGLAERCSPIPLTAVTDEQLHRVHDPDYVREVRRACAEGRTVVGSMDTSIGPESERIARLAAGSLAALCGQVARGELERGFAVVRPPGHHAERALAMGFCLFNNVAVAARELTAVGGQKRVLIVDWDVHHGNGTQHIFEEDADVMYFSLHQWPLYPGTGASEETGRGAGKGTTINCPLPPGSGDAPFLAALSDTLVPAAERFRPDFVLISAGFDAHRRDPLANLEVSTESYGEATRILREIADRNANWSPALNRINAMTIFWASMRSVFARRFLRLTSIEAGSTM